MAINTQVEYASVEDFSLDPSSPRIACLTTLREHTEHELLELMQKWVLDEIALSYLNNNGFWSHEPLLVLDEQSAGDKKMVVVDGNRRLAAIQSLNAAYRGKSDSPKWADIVRQYPKPASLFASIPFLRCDSRDDITAYLGFRHITGIKQWDVDKKGAYISGLVDSGKSYQDVARQIGSKSPTVRKHYIAYRTLLQIKDEVEVFDATLGEHRFSMLYFLVDTVGLKKYLQINTDKSPMELKKPVPSSHKSQLTRFSGWLFGTTHHEPLIRDIRQVNEFAKALESEEAVVYLESSKSPKIDVAIEIAEGEEWQAIEYINDAAKNAELALARIHAFKDSRNLQKAIRRFAAISRSVELTLKTS